MGSTVAETERWHTIAHYLAVEFNKYGPSVCYTASNIIKLTNHLKVINI